MPDKKIANLDPISTLSDDAMIPAYQDDSTKMLTGAVLKKYVEDSAAPLIDEIGVTVEKAVADASEQVDGIVADATAQITQSGADTRDAIVRQGEETRASIPEDYTSLSDDVVELKTFLGAASISTSSLTWSRSVVSNTNGTVSDSTTRLSSDIFPFPSSVTMDAVQLRASVYDGYGTALYDYLDDGSDTFVGWSGWQDEDYDYTLQTGHKYRISLRKTSNNSIVMANLDRLTLTYVPAIFATIDELSESVALLEEGSYIDTPGSDIQWEIGTIVGATGKNYASTGTIRTVGYLLADAGTTVSCNGGRHYVFRYSLADKTYIERIPSSYTTQDIEVTEACYIRITIIKAEGVEPAEISGDEIPVLAGYEAIRRFTKTVVSEIEESIVDSGFGAASYPSYFGPQITAAITSAAANILEAGRNGETFFFVSDLHWGNNEGHSPSLMRTIAEKLPIRNIICGGDLIASGTSVSQAELAASCIGAFNDVRPTFTALGNHDTNQYASDSTQHWSKSQAYGIVQKQSDYLVEYGEPCYFHFDNPTSKTRYIFLDTGYYSTNSQWEAGDMPATQRAWFENLLTDTQAGYHILVVMHVVYSLTGASSWPIGIDMDNLAMTAFAKTVCSIVDAHNVSGKQSTVEAIFAGHIHRDLDVRTDGGVPIVIIDTDSMGTLTTLDGTNRNSAAGTTTEQCFDVVTVNYNTHTIQCVRVGRGSNRVIPYSLVNA